MSRTPWVDALEAVYVASCLSCWHTAVRIGSDGKPICDWCRISRYEALREHLLDAFQDGAALAPRSCCLLTDDLVWIDQRGGIHHLSPGGRT